jgi:hypothetical protein
MAHRVRREKPAGLGVVDFETYVYFGNKSSILRELMGNAKSINHPLWMAFSRDVPPSNRGSSGSGPRFWYRGLLRFWAGSTLEAKVV